MAAFKFEDNPFIQRQLDYLGLMTLSGATGIPVEDIDKSTLCWYMVYDEELKHNVLLVFAKCSRGSRVGAAVEGGYALPLRTIFGKALDKFNLS